MHQVPLDEFIHRLHSHAEQGLSRAEAAARLKRDGPNRLTPRKQTPEFIKFLRQLTNLFALLLWCGAALSLVSEYVAPGQGSLAIAIALIGVVLLNGIFSYWQEHKAETIMASFHNMLPHRAKVVRDGQPLDIPASEVVRGDLLLLEEGDQISADARLLRVVGLKVDNSSLTGESEPQLRTINPTDRNLLESRNIVFSGTAVMAGSGMGIVFATAMKSQIGRTAELTENLATREVPIHRELRRFTHIISTIAVILGVLVFAVSLLWVDTPFWSKLVFAIGIIVANVPEGMLTTVTLCLSIAARRMAGKKALIRNLQSVETLGCTTVICTDKTGTLTANRMSLQRLFLNECIHSEADTAFEKEELEEFLRVAVLCNNARIAADGTLAGDPTETALLDFARRFHDPGVLRAAAPRLFEEPFTAASKEMVTINHVGEEKIACLKGAPDVAIARCDSILINGARQPFSAEHRQAYLHAYEELARRGERVLLFAWREVEEQDEWSVERLPQGGYTFIGLAGLFDPPRPEVPAAVAALRSAGVRVIMVTGDYQTTAAAIGRQVGIVTSDKPVMITGETLRTMSEAQLDWEIAQPEIIFARTSPEQKLRIVQALQRRGDVVAVTGDGVNDAPALKQADIGIAMGLSGTDVAREAADMILLDDNFATLLPAVREGRTIFANLRKATSYILTSNVPEITPFLAFLLLGVPLPLTVILILAIDLGTDMLPAIALGSEPAESDIMQLPPRSRSEHLVNVKLMGLAYGFFGIIESAAGFYAYFTVLLAGGWRWGQSLGGSDTLYLKAVTAFFVAIILCQVANGLISKTSRQSLLQQGLFSNLWLLVGIAVELLLAAVVVYTPFLHPWFGTTSLSFAEFFLAWPFALGLLLLDEVRRWWVRRRGGQGRQIEVS
jgi:sodium/potassium-transporting ATPase subunit alpha